jgi:hypothetical protein
MSNQNEDIKSMTYEQLGVELTMMIATVRTLCERIDDIKALRAEIKK